MKTYVIEGYYHVGSDGSCAWLTSNLYMIPEHAVNDILIRELQEKTKLGLDEIHSLTCDLTRIRDGYDITGSSGMTRKAVKLRLKIVIDELELVDNNDLTCPKCGSLNIQPYNILSYAVIKCDDCKDKTTFLTVRRND